MLDFGFVSCIILMFVALYNKKKCLFEIAYFQLK